MPARLPFLLCCLPFLLFAGTADEGLLLLPPAWDSRVVFYHTFENGPDQPRINLAEARIETDGAEWADGFTGKGLAARKIERRTGPTLRLTSPAFSVHRPFTVMFWWRLDEPMAETSNFALLKIGNHQGRHGGYIANFVRGKGEWCALKEPTYVSQLYNFPGLTNRNMPWGGRVWAEPGEWRHTAITVSAARQIDIHWDGRQRESFQAKGRLFAAGDTNALSLGPDWLFHPMTIDEVIVLDRALAADEIAAYVRAARALRAIGR